MNQYHPDVRHREECGGACERLSADAGFCCFIRVHSFGHRKWPESKTPAKLRQCVLLLSCQTSGIGMIQDRYTKTSARPTYLRKDIAVYSTGAVATDFKRGNAQVEDPKRARGLALDCRLS